MGIGAASSLLGEAAAQGTQIATGARSEFSPREMAAQTIYGATPFVSTGNAAARMLANVGSSIATSEAARYVSNPDEYKAPQSVSEGLSRFGLPAIGAAGATALSRFGEAVAQKGAAAEKIRAGSPQALSEFGVSMGREPLLQDLFPSQNTGRGFIASITQPANIERAAVSRANEKAISAMENALVGPSEGFAELRRNAPDLFPLTEDIRKNIGVLEPLYQSAKKSRDEAARLMQQAQDMQIQGLAEAPAALEAAKLQNLKAFSEDYTYKLAWEKALGKSAPKIQDISLGERNNALRIAGEVARDARDVAVSAAYKAAGIGENDAVVSVADILNKADKKITANATRAEFKDAILSAFGDDPAAVIDRTSFIEARDRLAAAITQKTPGIDPTLATRKANQYYQTMKEASLDFIKRERPEQYSLFDAAQKRAAKFFDATDTKAYDLLAKGDANAFYKAAKETGKSTGSIYDQASRFAEVLKQEGAKDVADGLMKSINTAIRDGVLSEVTQRGTGLQGSRPVDASALVRELQSLHDSGFPVGKLGLGTVKDIQVLARIAGAGKGAGLTTSEANRFFDDLERLGVDRAGARLRYTRAVRDSFLDTTAAGRLQAAQRARGEARRAALSAQDQEQIANNLKNDPLIKFINEQGSETAVGLSKDPAKNAKFIETILTLEPNTVSGFMDALRKSNRTGDAAKLEKAVVASVFGKFGTGSSEIDLAGILDTFRNPKNEPVLQSLKAVLGQQGFDSLKRNVVQPLDQLAKSYERAGTPLPSSFNQLRTAITAADAVRKQSLRTTGTYYLTNSLRGAIEALQNKQYNLLHALYIDPNTAPKFARAGYSLNKFVQQPVNAAVVRLANELDNQIAAENANEAQGQ
jgi:hypothetical protein